MIHYLIRVTNCYFLKYILLGFSNSVRYDAVNQNTGRKLEIFSTMHCFTDIKDKPRVAVIRGCIFNDVITSHKLRFVQDVGNPNLPPFPLIIPISDVVSDQRLITAGEGEVFRTLKLFSAYLDLSKKNF